MENCKLKVVRGLALLSLVWIVALSAWGQEPSPANDAWARLQALVGSWNGHETGMSGIGQGSRTYESVLGGKYLFQKNTSRFKPQLKNPKGEVHQDWAMFSFDQQRRKVVLREFHSEGFVNQYVLDDSHADEGQFVFNSESFENVPPGWRARLTLNLKSPYNFHEVFELARPGQEFKVTLENDWTRERSRGAARN